MPHRSQYRLLFMGLASLCILQAAVPCHAQVPERMFQLLDRMRDFDGLSDFHSFRLPDESNRWEQLTVSGWVYPRLPEGALRDRYVLTLPYKLLIRMATNRDDAGPLDTAGPLRCTLFVKGEEGGWKAVEISSPHVLQLNCWSHFAMTYNQEKIRLFIDGRPVAELNETRPVSVDARSRQGAVGCLDHSWSQSEFWAGLLHHVQIYGRALSPHAIGKLAAAEPPQAPGGFQSDGPAKWVFNGGLEGQYKNRPQHSFPPQWYGSIWRNAKGRWKQDTLYPHTGKAAMEMEIDAMPGGGGMSFYQPSSRIPLIPGRKYTLSAWMRSDFDVEVRMAIQGTGPGVFKHFDTVRRWKKYTISDTYTGVTSSGFIIFSYQSKRPGNLVIDDIELTINSPDPTVQSGQQ